jgi:hypothetical protein
MLKRIIGHSFASGFCFMSCIQAVIENDMGWILVLAILTAFNGIAALILYDQIKDGLRGQ